MKNDARLAVALAFAILLPLAGCTGTVGSDSPTATAAGPTATTGGTATTGAAGGPVYATPLDPERVAAAHAAALRDAGSFTYRSSLALSTSNGSADGAASTGRIETAARVDLSTGAALVRRNASGGNVETTYVAADGAAYRRSELPGLNVTRYRQPAFEVNASAYAEPNLSSPIRGFEFAYAGTDTVDGTPVHVYEATDPGQVASRNDAFSDVRNVSEVDVALAITADGLVKRYDYRVVGDVRNRTRELTVSLTYADVGETTVDSPPWLAEARERIEERTTRPDPSERVRTTVENASLGASVTLTVPRYDERAVDLEPNGNPVLESDAVDRARASPLVEVRLPDSAANATLRLRYDEAEVPDGDEAGLVVMRFDRERQTYLPVETRLDAAANAAAVDLGREGTYVVFHEETWASAFG